jgi:glycosyltransferase involved in cell wall biosynthesis
MTPLVSILIPAYNAERWIADAIRSALAQTWPKKEIIVVDDGSTDQTLHIARGFASKSILIATQPNQGASTARNHAFSLSQGGYIQWLDADDLLAPSKVSLQMKAIEHAPSPRTLLSGAWGAFFFRVEKAKFSPSPLWCDLTPTEWLIRKMTHGAHMQTANWLVSRELTEAAGPWDTRLLGDDDGEYFCRVLLQAASIVFVAGAKSYYRSVGESQLSEIGRSNAKLEAQFLSNELHIKYLRSLEDTERSRAASVRYLQKYMFDFYPERPDIVQKARELAQGLGGRLELPQSSWKYAWIHKTLGWKASKRAQLTLPKIKTRFYRTWDGLCFRSRNRRLPRN